MSDLKPCPFCEAALAWSDTYSEYHHPVAKCILSGHKFKKGMIGQWNRRVLPAAQPDAVSRDAVMHALQEWTYCCDAEEVVRALPAVQPVTVQQADAQQIQTLREEIAKLETLCDHDCDNEDCLRCFHYPEILEQKRTALRALAQPDLSDPAVVHLNMLRGTIAKPSLKQIIHLYGVDALAPLIVREAGNEPS